MHRKTQIILEVAANLHLTAEALDAARLAGRHLAKKSLIDWVVPVCNTADLKHRMDSTFSHVAGIFAERSFLFSTLKWNLAFYNNLSRSGNLKINGKAANYIHGLAAYGACCGQFVHAIRKGTHGGQADYRIGAEDDGRLGRATLAFIFADVLVHVAWRVNHEPCFSGPFNLHPINAHVGDSSFGITRDNKRRGVVRAGVLPYCPHGCRQPLDIGLFSHTNHILTWPALHKPRWHRILAPLPFFPHTLEVRF